VSQELTVSRVQLEHLRETLGVGAARPRISWMVSTAVSGWTQAAYEIEATDPDGRPRTTGRVETDRSVLVPWPFEPLVSRTAVSVRVRVWGTDDQASGWSTPLSAEAGLFRADDWTARFIAPDWDEDTSQMQPGPLMRREFDVRNEVARARLYVTALGLYEIQVNGGVVGDHALSPGWTSYNRRLRYQTFDVTDLLRAGRNAIGAMLGDGWYRGRLGFFGGRRNIYGDRLALLAQMEILYADGTTDLVVTDASWHAARGPVRAADIYDGETYDARLEPRGWSKPGCSESGWTGVRLLDRDLGTLAAPSGPPVRRTQIMRPVSIMRSPSGCTIVDFGQNVVGRLRIAVEGPAGQTITLRHAEVLENGELCTRPLRTAKATDRFTLRGGGLETWEPRFTFHGFRYAEVEGWPGELRADDISAVVCHSDMERTGWFECSNPLINKLHENIVWTMRGNFLDVPTDCPQRDERLGWAGDLELFSPTASTIYDTAGFLMSWLADLTADQGPDGAVPIYIPNIKQGPIVPSTFMSDAAVIVPWVLYQRFGDTDLLERQFDSMRAWVDYVTQKAGDRLLYDKDIPYGDWLDPAAPPDRPGDTRTDPFLVSTAYFVRSTDLVARAARVLGKEAEAERYEALAARIRDAFAREYLSVSGRVVSDSATGYALAIQFGLLRDEEQRRNAGARLAQIARDSQYCISTGLVGTAIMCDALCSVGEYDTAFRMLTQRACPSWLYAVTMGATTVWERWDSLLPDGSVNPGAMTSFNHYALGAVGDWIYRTVGGIAASEAGYRRLDIQPHIGGGVTSARIRHLTPYGMAECAWQLDGGQVHLEVVLPPNTAARVALPQSHEAPVEVGSGTHRWSYRAVQPPRRLLNLESGFSELFADAELWAAIVKLAPEMAVLQEITPVSSGTTLRIQLLFQPNAEEMMASLESALAKLGYLG
jgi:alpha-L-rhamnosidase